MQGAEIMPLHSSLDNRDRPCSQKNKKEKTRKEKKSTAPILKTLLKKIQMCLNLCDIILITNYSDFLQKGSKQTDEQHY